VVSDGVDGFLWTRPEELKQRTLELIGDPAQRERMGGLARQASRRWSRSEFKRRMLAELSPVIHDLENQGGTLPIRGRLPG
jgi:hypothetical protein